MEDLRLEAIVSEVEKELKESEKAIRTAKNISGLAYKVAKRTAKKFLPKMLITTDREYLEYCIETNYTLYDKIIEYHEKERKGELTKKQRVAWGTFKKAMSLFKRFSRVIQPFIDEFLTVDFILEAIQESKPELVEVLRTEKGLKWLKTNIEELRSILGV